jgi:predicted peroxiredoxin
MCDDEIGKIAVVCNHDDEQSVMAALVMGAAVAATGDQVLMFFQPGAAKVLVKGELEKFQGLKGQPDPLDLFESIKVLDGRFILCELGMPIWDIKEEDLREGVEVMMASTFLFEAEDAKLSFSY